MQLPTNVGLAGTRSMVIGCDRTTTFPTLVTPPGTGTVAAEFPRNVWPFTTAVAWTTMLPCTVGTSGSENVPSPADVVVRVPTATLAPPTGADASLTMRPCTVV